MVVRQKKRSRDRAATRSCHIVPSFGGHKLLPEWAVRRGADGQVPGHSVTGDVDRLSTEQRAETVEQGQCEDSTTVLSVDIIAAAKPSVRGGLGDRCG